MLDDRDDAAVLDADPDADVLPGRHSQPDDGVGKGTWLRTLGLTPADLAGKIIPTSAYKGGVGKTTLAYELAYLLGGILVDLDWDWGNASRAWGYREETRVGSPLLDALDRGRVPRPLAGGPWRPDLVPCSRDFEANQPEPSRLADALETWAAQWAKEYQCPIIVDTHPGGSPSTFGALSAAHAVVTPVILGEKEMSATEGMVNELKSYPLILVPNKASASPPERYINWLARIADGAGLPVAEPVSKYDRLGTRSRRMAVCASDPVPAWATRFVEEMESVATMVVRNVLAAQ